MTPRDFSQFISTDEDRRTVRRWTYGSALVYGLLGLLVIGGSVVRIHQTDMSQTAKATSPAAMATAANTHRTR